MTEEQKEVKKGEPKAPRLEVKPVLYLNSQQTKGSTFRMRDGRSYFVAEDGSYRRIREVGKKAK